MELALVIIVVAFALGFDYTNGFHDAANAIATSVSTRALTPRAALIMAAVFNLVGALLGTQVATTIAEDIINIGGRLLAGGADHRPVRADRRDQLEPHHLVARACRRRPRTPSSAA